jgi:glutamine amidotransferase
MSTAIIDTSTANIASVRFALERLGVEPILARDPDEAARAERLILPGVGAAGPAMATLRARGWTERLQDDVRPLLGVCLGMQLLFDHSEESGADLLGLIPGQVRRLDPGSAGPWPHMGWNTLEFDAQAHALLEGVEAGSRVYFVHGFAVEPGPFAIATTRYGAPVTAIAAKGRVMGCQFHPERSSRPGAQILSNFLKLEAA